MQGKEHSKAGAENNVKEQKPVGWNAVSIERLVRTIFWQPLPTTQDSLKWSEHSPIFWGASLLTSQASLLAKSYSVLQYYSREMATLFQEKLVQCPHPSWTTKTKKHTARSSTTTSLAPYSISEELAVRGRGPGRPSRIRTIIKPIPLNLLAIRTPKVVPSPVNEFSLAFLCVHFPTFCEPIVDGWRTFA